MVSTELLKHEREQIELVKEMGIPELMRKACTKDYASESIRYLYEIMESFDFPELEKPAVKFEELKLTGQDDALASLFYIWANFNLEAGDGSYFEDEGDDFIEFLKKEGGVIGKSAAYLAEEENEFLSCNNN